MTFDGSPLVSHGMARRAPGRARSPSLSGCALGHSLRERPEACHSTTPMIIELATFRRAVFVGVVQGLVGSLAYGAPDMLAPPDQFAAAIGRLGIDNDTWSSPTTTWDCRWRPLGSGGRCLYQVTKSSAGTRWWLQGLEGRRTGGFDRERRTAADPLQCAAATEMVGDKGRRGHGARSVLDGGCRLPDP